jgi:hypothetical protein
MDCATLVPATIVTLCREVKQQLVWVHQGSITVVVTLLNWGQLALDLKTAFAA